MYLFTRSARLVPGRIRDAMTWAAEITEKVNQISELPVTLWRTVLSPEVGRLTWSTMTEQLAELEAVEDKLLADDGYVELVDRGAGFTNGEMDDRVASVLHAPADFAERRVEYVTVVTAQAANGQFARAVEVAIQIAEKAKAASGVDTAVTIASTGPYAELAWLSGAADLGELQRSEEAINNDPEFIQLLDGAAGEVYVQGSGQQRIVRRVL